MPVITKQECQVVLDTLYLLGGCMPGEFVWPDQMRRYFERSDRILKGALSEPESLCVHHNDRAYPHV